MKTNTCSSKHTYRISPYTDNPLLQEFKGQIVNYTRGAFHTAATGHFVTFEQVIHENDLDIFIEGCHEDHSDVEPWMGNCNEPFFDSLAQYLQDGFVCCEICEQKLSAKENR
jgi:hypothetical protein